MRIPARDVTYITLSVYLLTFISPIRHTMDHTQVNVIQLKTFELELDFTEYIQHTDVRIADLCWVPDSVTSYLRTDLTDSRPDRFCFAHRYFFRF